MRMQTTSLRISFADRKTLTMAAKLTGRTYSEYMRDLSVQCAVRFLIEEGFGSKLPAEHQALWRRQLEECDVQDAVASERRKRQSKRKAA